MSTYTPVASQTLSASASSVTFSNIPQDYTDLVMVCQFSGASSGQSPYLQINGDTGTTYSGTLLTGNGTTAASSRYSSDTQISDNSKGISTTAGANIITWQFQNYSNSTTYKTVLFRTTAMDGASYQGVTAGVGLWRSTSSITSIKFYLSGSVNLASGTTVSLYGIQAGTPKAQGGQIVTTDGTYWYHAFTASGTFTPSTAITADYLVVAGGGGGSRGGGGAGGLRSTVTATGGGGSLESALSLSANTAYSVVIGAGGAGDAGASATGKNGSDSVFSSITSTGGGAGSADGLAAVSGGSGGGAATSGYNGAAGTTNQGYAGGNGFGSSTTRGGGGGGGAGAVGTNGSSATGGAGGAGVSISALATATNTSVSNYYAGGGGAWGWTTKGSGGSGGGGGASATDGTAGTANTGSGGGAGGNNGGAGGSGIVIIRYSV